MNNFVVPSDCAALIFRPDSTIPELLLPEYRDDEIVPESSVDAVLAAGLFTERNEDLLSELFKRLEVSSEA